MTLLEEVEASRQQIRSDGYAMSIGEIVNLYRDREIQIRPAYQRLFRWPVEKQSRLIESILLGIPLPTIFVAQREDGVWEVVDGLQRLSTILKFMGELRIEGTGEIYPPTTLRRTKYLPSLEGVSYHATDDGRRFPTDLKIHFKRARLDFRILLRESDERVKYELFDRLNSGGTPTSPQEVRSAQLVMTSPPFHSWLERLRAASPFADCVPVSDRQLSEQYDLELVTRYFVLANSTSEELSRISDMDTFLSDQILNMAASDSFDRAAQQETFEAVFDVLSALGPDVFRRYDERRGRTSGAFSVPAFEAATLGVTKHIADWKSVDFDARSFKLRSKLKELWSDADFLRFSDPDFRAAARVPMMPIVGARIFTVE